MACSITSKVSKRSAKSCMVQHSRPLGGGVHAKAIRKASCLPASFAGAPLRDSSESAQFKPPHTNFRRTRSMVAILALVKSLISSSVYPSSAKRKMFARRRRRAGTLPLHSKCSMVVSSSAFKVTTYFSDMRALPFLRSVYSGKLPLKTFVVDH